MLFNTLEEVYRHYGEDKAPYITYYYDKYVELKVEGNGDLRNLSTERKQLKEHLSIPENEADALIGFLESLATAKAKEEILKKMFGSLEELKSEELPPLTFTVQDFLPSSGAFILSAKPKVGKTFLALQIAEAVATGDKFLNTFDTEKGQVLYVMTQGGKRVLKHRIELIQKSGKQHNDFYYLTGISPLQQGGYKILEKFIKCASNPKLIILDMITGMIPNHKHSNYQAWAGVFEDLNNFALDNNICILCVYHSRKNVDESSDSSDDVIGSTGILGSVSGALTLRRLRDKGEGEIFITLREAESKKKTLLFNNAKWSYVGDYLPTRQSEKDIYFLLSKDSGLTNKEIAEQLNKQSSNVSTTLKKMLEANFIYSENGRYYLRSFE